jgi:addiction module RelE/StbE family toxin
MIRVRLTKIFRRRFRRRIIDQYLNQRFYQRLKLFVHNPQNRVLHDHQLGGKLSGFRAFSLTDDFRVIYHQDSPNKVSLVDLGTHPQVYSQSKR